MDEKQEVSIADAAALEAVSILNIIEPLLLVKSAHTTHHDGTVSMLWKNQSGEIGISVKGNGYASWFAEDIETGDMAYNSDEPISDVTGQNSSLLKFINEHVVCKG